jgi:hypothetical protein
MAVDMQTGRGLRFQMPKPYISAHDGDPSADRIRASLEAARARVRAGKGVAECPAACLLGEGRLGGLTVKCGVEHSLIAERTDPSSLSAFCLAPANAPGGGYTACSTWRAENARRTAAPLIDPSEGV